VGGVLTLGDVLAPDVLRVPPNVAVHAFAPHAALLAHASLVVTHAGLGTVMAALAHGVPLVSVPMGRDQDTNAARVEALGAGRALAGDAGAPEIGRAIAEVLGTPSYREAAARVQRSFAAAPGVSGAAEELEALCAR
jgi:MGT family glycosyltransferase